MFMGRLKKYGLRALLLSLSTVLLMAVTTTYAARYVVTQLISPEPLYSTARSINNKGNVTGWTTFGSFTSVVSRGYIFKNHSTMLLSAPDGTSYTAGMAINEAGQVAGYAPVSGNQHAILWTNGVPQDLGVLSGTTGSYPYAINDLGAVVGYSGAYPFVWQSGVMSRIGTATGMAYSINLNGDVVGMSNNVPVIWDSTGNVTNLSTYSGNAYHINDARQVVGRHLIGGVYKGFLWQDGILQNLLLPEGASTAIPLSINNSGVMVGEGGFSQNANRAIIWDYGTASDLNTLISAGSGWVLVRAWDINSSGQIVGEGTYNGRTLAFLLTPTLTPVTVSAASGTAGCSGWYTSPVTVTLTATDRSGTGIKEIHYTLDGATEVVIGDVTATIPVSGDAAHTLSYYAVDYAGNVEAPNTLAVQIDGLVPSSTSSVSGTAGANGWYKSPVTVQINGNDATSGVGSIKYRKKVNGNWGSTVAAGNPAFVSFGNFSSGGSNGLFSVGYNAVDRACNAETENFVDVNIDSIAPITTYAPSMLPNANGWYNTDVTVNFTASDNLSGVDYLAINGANVPGYTSSSVIGEGISAFNYSATDMAGMAESTKSATFSIDKTVPVVTVSTTPAELAASNKPKLVPVTINGSAGDSLSGIASVVITIADEYGSYNMTVPSFGSTVNLDTYKNRKDADGRLYTIQATATDLAGNQQTAEYSLWVK